MAHDDNGTEFARSPNQPLPLTNGKTVGFVSWLPNLSGIYGTRRRVALIGCIACMILAPVSVLLSMLDANESHGAVIPAVVFCQVIFLFAMFGLAVWILTTSLAKIVRPDQRSATQ